MCLMSTPSAPDPVMPVEYAAQKAPTTAQTTNAAQRMRDSLRASAPTLLTGPNGTGATDTSGKKQLLGA